MTAKDEMDARSAAMATANAEAIVEFTGAPAFGTATEFFEVDVGLLKVFEEVVLQLPLRGQFLEHLDFFANFRYSGRSKKQKLSKSINITFEKCMFCSVFGLFYSKMA